MSNVFGDRMSRLEELEAEISKLSEMEFSELRNWMLERDAEAWDRQIDRDTESGKLEGLFDKSLANHRAGSSSEL